MAHKILLKAQVISIPMTVALYTTPCTWEMHSEKRVHLDPTSGRLRRVHTEVRTFHCTEKPEIPGIFFDARFVKDEFLKVRTEYEFLGFLKHFGKFSAPPGEEPSWDINSFFSCQQLFRLMMSNPPATWNRTVKLTNAWDQAHQIEQALNDSSMMPMKFLWRQRDHTAFVEARDVVTAILSVIQIDHLREIQYRPCRRHDCGKMFEVTRRGKLYCDQSCAHLASVRATRKRIKERSKGTGPK